MYVHLRAHTRTQALLHLRCWFGTVPRCHSSVQGWRCYCTVAIILL